MPLEFRIPDLGEGIAEVELRKWLVREGDQVAEHQAVLEVETDKAVVEVPSPHAGRVERLLRREGEMVAVGEPVLVIAGPAAGPPVIPPGEAPARPKSVGIVGELPEAEDTEQPVLATPAVRKMARERGIDLARVKGSGPRGCILPEDLALTVSPPKQPADAGPVERVPLRGVRRTIARNVLASQRATAFVTGMEEADITDLWALRQREQGVVEAHGTHLTFLPVFMKAVQHALREHPYLNASIDDEAEEIVVKKHYHFGIAAETPDGLMVPVIRDVDRKSMLQLAAEVQALGKKARERTISTDEMKGSSFTITNYGHFGGVFATPIINWPDVAILGFGRIADRPWVYRGELAIRKIVPLSLTFDHRVCDGAEAALFLRKVVGYLEDPALLLLESI